MGLLIASFLLPVSINVGKFIATDVNDAIHEVSTYFNILKGGVIVWIVASSLQLFLSAFSIIGYLCNFRLCCRYGFMQAMAVLGGICCFLVICGAGSWAGFTYTYDKILGAGGVHEPASYALSAIGSIVLCIAVGVAYGDVKRASYAEKANFARGMPISYGTA